MPVWRSITCFLLRCQHAWRLQNATTGVLFDMKLTKRNAVCELECRRHWHSSQLLLFPSGISPRPGLTVYLLGLFNNFDIPAVQLGTSSLLISTLPDLQSQLDGHCKDQWRQIADTACSVRVDFLYVCCDLYYICPGFCAVDNKAFVFLHLLRITHRRATRPQVLFRQHHPHKRLHDHYLCVRLLFYCQVSREIPMM